jgi:hypothetical protein
LKYSGDSGDTFGIAHPVENESRAQHLAAADSLRSAALAAELATVSRNLSAEGGFQMKARFTFGVIASLFIASLAWAATNLNSSKSNIYRLTYPSDLLSRDQAKAILAELDSMGPADEAKLKQWLPANFKRFGIARNRVKKLIVLAPDKELKEIAIILLTKPEDEAAARATTVKSSKSNSSE